jgi:hypothetical protein
VHLLDLLVDLLGAAGALTERAQPIGGDGIEPPLGRVVVDLVQGHRASLALTIILT